ncbi:MAG: protein kinase, partial [Chitinispirillaceae bacterium]|nr:protein kinase [Chitinispirillaceae bacterium]
EMQTGGGSVLGTLCYLAPEALVSPSDVDTRVDIFALGCILYRILSGALPFDGPSVGDVSNRILNEQPAPLDDRSPLAAITLRCLEKERDKRPSIAEVHRTLRDVIAPEYHTCSERLLAFMAGGTSSAVRPKEPPVLPAGACRRPGGFFPLSGRALLATVMLGITLIASVLLLVKSHDVIKTDLPRLPGTSALLTLESPSPDAYAKKNAPGAPNAPAPLTGAAIAVESVSIVMAGIVPDDSVFLDGRFILKHRTGNSVAIKAEPGRHHLNLRRNGRSLLSRDLDLLPYERLNVDLHNERKRNDSVPID